MIEIYVAIIMLVFVLVVLSGFFTGASLFLNPVLLGLMLILTSIDIKKKYLQKYYLISLFLTAIFFILSNSNPIKSLLALASKASLSLFTMAFILIYVFAHLSGLAHIGIETMMEKYRK